MEESFSFNARGNFLLNRYLLPSRIAQLNGLCQLRRDPNFHWIERGGYYGDQ